MKASSLLLLCLMFAHFGKPIIVVSEVYTYNEEELVEQELSLTGEISNTDSNKCLENYLPEELVEAEILTKEDRPSI